MADVTVFADGLNKGQEVYEAAKRLFEESPDWVIFFRRILGTNGLVRDAFPLREELKRFEQTELYAEIHQMLTQLRQRSTPNGTQQEPIRVITVRLPESLHETLSNEAHEYRTSMNKLCISKLLRLIEMEAIEEVGQLEGGGGADL